MHLVSIWSSYYIEGVDSRMKVYLVEFEYDGEHTVEGIFKTRRDARNYIYNQALERGLYEGEIWISERVVGTESRMDDKNAIAWIKEILDLVEEDAKQSLAEEYGWIDNL